MTEGPGRVLIVTDGRDSTDDIAGEIARIVGRTASTVGAGTFGGADLLPAGVFFLGCAEPSPRAFGYLEILFAHIGLAGRSCGVFSRDAGALDYLRELVRPSEAMAGRPFLAGSDG
ncbi:MAG: hypothetical protein FWD94_04370, partial [Treponema sp.]|nr:hypothetical protein [Treponema sp.]